MIRKTSKNRKRHGGLQYNSLEERRLLAMLVVGGEGNDLVEVTHVDTNIVTVKINETVMENLDISDGLRINTKGGNQDQVWIDHQITARIGVFNAEELVISGGRNFWQIGFMPDEAIRSMDSSSAQYDAKVPIAGKVAGRINDNIRFLGTNTLRSGDGVDVYSINTSFTYRLNIYGGGGNDLFRVTAKSYLKSSTRPPVTLHGEGGHDRFVLRNQARINTYGGSEFDILDYSQASYGATEIAGDKEFGIWGNGIERIIGAEDRSNHFSSRSSGSEDYRFNWIIDGNRTTVADNEHQAFVELVNFDDFHGDPNGFDRFWVKETVDNIRISDADWIQISSEFRATEGNLESINHDIAILKTMSSTPVDDVDLSGNETSSIHPAVVDLDGVINPRVIISDATGDGSVAAFIENQTIAWMSGAKVTFGTSSLDDASGELSEAEFLPEIIVHGSLTAADHFTFRNTWSPVSIYSHGGDDTFMFGSTNKRANGDMNRIEGEVNVFAGSGTDRVYVNDQASFLGTTRYEVSDQLIRDGSFYSDIVTLPTIRDAVIARRFADINLNQTIEVSRINGSTIAPNYFEVVPSAITKFVVNGSDQAHDRLNIAGFERVRKLSDSEKDYGAWIYDDFARNVAFFDVDDPNAPPIEWYGLIQVGTDFTTRSISDEFALK